jgi:ferredoxin
MSIDVLDVVQKQGTFPNTCVQCGTCIDTCPEKVLGFRFSSESFGQKGLENTGKGRAA